MTTEPLSTMVERKANGAVPPDEEVPIAVLDGVVGALGVRGSPQDPLTAEERELLESIARQASEALQRARLLDEARGRARRERLIRDIADRMQRAIDLQSLIRIASEELVSALGASRAYVRMGTPDELLQD
jgi:GAF domain-containing protein